MNILLLHGTSDLYGGSKVLISFVKSIISKGDHPIVVLSEKGPLVEKLEELNVEVQIIRLGILRRKYLSPAGILNRIIVTRKAWKTLQNLIAERDIQLVYSHTTGVLIGALIARKLKIRHIWHVLEITTRPVIFVKMMGYLLNNFSESVIVASDAVKQHLEKWVDKDKLIRIYNYIDPAPFQDQSASLKNELCIPADSILIGMIGRVNHWKGQYYFMEIAKEILKKFPDTHFVMAGDAYPGNESLFDQLNADILKQELQHKIHNIGYRTDIVNILNSLDIFVLPSILPDPFPTVILEAMAASKPVVATNHGGALEMIADMESGLLIPFNNAIESANKLSVLITDAEKRQTTGENAKKRML
ncbi:MAG TPA: group 1 glycosyl transferase, partial [Sphingobacteriaceae bacterium]|nr:group 1 glycosyl transferase [Sphingobacteriaceae bacterium]